MDSVLRDRVGWECPGESTDSGSGSDFTRSRWANDILDAEEKFQKAMITVLNISYVVRWWCQSPSIRQFLEKQRVLQSVCQVEYHDW